VDKGAGGANGYAVSANETEFFRPVKRNRDRFLIPDIDDFRGACLAADSATGAGFLINNKELHDVVLLFEFMRLPRTCLHL
jgi:hypothetical protein